MSHYALPSLWKPMQENLEVVQLQTWDAEYNTVKQNFVKTASGNGTITKISRIQNRQLWQQYQAKKREVESRKAYHHPVERLLWHGTTGSAVDSINVNGFRKSYSGKNGTAYGAGIYFACNANNSNGYSHPDSSGILGMYFCRVLTGDFAQGSQGIKVPPSKTGVGVAAVYDSVVDNVQSPSMFVVFNDDQVYPEYLVLYKR